MIEISVIIPSYKPGKYLFECLDTLFNQTLSKDVFEVILILNGCNEPYADRIYDYINKHRDFSIKFRQTDVPGVSNARNIGIESVHGEYITFIDDDDIVSPTYLERLLAFSSPTCVGCANSYAFINDISEQRVNFIRKAFEKCSGLPFTLYDYRQYLSPPVAKLIHRSIIADSRFPIDMKKSEDSVFCLKISPRIEDMKLASPDAVYYQRLREGSSMRKKESIWSIIKEHLFIEYKYFSVWVKNPFRYNLKFFLSRIVACGRNCLHYIRNQKYNK